MKTVIYAAALTALAAPAHAQTCDRACLRTTLDQYLAAVVKHDPSVNTTIEQPTGVGAKQHWTSKNGNGELEFTASDEEKGIEYTMLFDKKYASKGSMSYTKAGDDTRVTWRMTGQNDDFVGKWMAFAMPYMMRPMFDEGLVDLKNKVESK